MNDYQYINENGSPRDYYEIVNENGELCKEIERLNNIINELEEELKEYRKPVMQYYKKVTSIGDKNDR